MLIRIEAGRTYAQHSHHAPDEVVVVAGTYCDPGVENGRAFAASAYRCYPPGTAPRAGRPAGSEGGTLLVWNSGK